jgi:hypothetical protein
VAIHKALDGRYALDAEGFVKGRKRFAMPPLSAAINPILQSKYGSSIIDDQVNFPTLTAAGYV